MSDIEELQQLLKQEEERRAKVQALFEKKKQEEREASLKKAQQKEFSQAEQDEIRKVFELFDADKSGHINTSELAEVSKSLGCEMSDAELNETIKSIDLNADKQIDFKEFLQWWGSDKLLGGNKGVKLRLLRTRLAARMAKNGTLEKLRTVGKTELGGRNITVEADVVAGKIHKDWQPAVELHGLALPLSEEAFKMEAKRLIKVFQEHSDVDTRSDYWDHGVQGTRFEKEALKGLAKISFALHPEVTRDRAEELVAKYNRMKKELSEEDDSHWVIEGEHILPHVYIRVQAKKLPGGKEECLLFLDAMIPLRYAKPFQQVVEIANETLHLGAETENASDSPDKVFESVAFSFKNDMDPLAWLHDGSGVAQLLAKFQTTIKATFSRGILQLYQSYIFSSSVGRHYYTRVFAKAVAQMIILAMAGGASLRLKLRSFGEVVEDMGESFGQLHREFINRAVQEGDIKVDGRIAELLSSSTITDHWKDRLKCLLYNFTASEVLGFARAWLGSLCTSSDDVFSTLFGMMKEAVSAPVKIQIVTSVACVSLNLKGFQFITSNLPGDAEEGARWEEEYRKVSREIWSKLDDVLDDGRRWYDLVSSAEDAEWRVGKVSRRVAVAGMPGCGKTTLVHRAATGMGVSASPTEKLSIKNAAYRGRTYPMWEYWDAPTGFASVPEFMIDREAMDGPVTLVWLVDSSVGVQPGERESFKHILNVFNPDMLQVVIVAAKCDLAPAETSRTDLAAQAKEGVVDRETLHDLGSRLSAIAVTGMQYESSVQVLEAIRALERVAKKNDDAAVLSEAAHDSDSDEAKSEDEDDEGDWFD